MNISNRAGYSYYRDEYIWKIWLQILQGGIYRSELFTDFTVMNISVRVVYRYYRDEYIWQSWLQILQGVIYLTKMVTDITGRNISDRAGYRYYRDEYITQSWLQMDEYIWQKWFQILQGWIYMTKLVRDITGMNISNRAGYRYYRDEIICQSCLQIL